MMRAACIDIGSNTTRLLVAECVDGVLRELLAQRSFTKLGRDLRRHDGSFSDEKRSEVAGVVNTQIRLAHEMGATKIRAVATAAVRESINASLLLDEVAYASGLVVEVLSEQDEARLGFLGATRMVTEDPGGSVAVIDVGGGSSEVAIGTLADGVNWTRSFAVGSGQIADQFMVSDPPAVDELHAAREAVSAAFEGVEFPSSQLAIATGGTASSLRRLVGSVVDHETLERAIRLVARKPAKEVAAQFALDFERVEVLPAGVMIIEEIGDRLGIPLRVGKGGLREGVVIELLLQGNGTGRE